MLVAVSMHASDWRKFKKVEPTPVNMTSQTHEYLIFWRLHKKLEMFENIKEGTTGEYAYVNIEQFSACILQKLFWKLTCNELVNANEAG